MQQLQSYPIDDLLDFLDPAFPEWVARGLNWDFGFGASTDFRSGKVDAGEVQRQLGSYIEEWIDSGFHEDGSEWPYERNFAPKSSRAVWSLDDGEPNLCPPPQAVKAMARFCNGTLQVRGNSYLIVGHEEANTSSSVSVSIGPRGGIQYEPTTQCRDGDAETMAAGMFLFFYHSEWLYRLMKCRQCGVFAVPDRKPRKSYVRGWHCRPCGRTVSATISVAERRKDQRKKWFNLAVDAVRRWEQRPRDQNRIEWIKDEVNKGLRLVDQIKRNTITHNLKDIEARAKGDDHAKG
jgi:hypothetical protein